MKNKPLSFIIFLGVILILLLVAICALLFSHFNVDKNYAIFLALFQLIASAASIVGIIMGFIYKPKQKRDKILNRIAIAGNFFVIIFVLAIIIYALKHTKF